ncbi:MAG TPA: metallophosphoesterase family protein [Thermomicrobiales bacterium]|nr:metallophosphoesterase family protein [Thermomicrobiales bacterium]
MRLGLIADIHGNLVALETVLAALQRDRVDEIVCLGDVAVLGPQPGDVIARLRALGCRCVLGNTDAWLIPDPILAAEPAMTIPVADLTRWCAEHLSTADVAFLRSLPLTIEVPLGMGRTLVAFHASPRSLDNIIAATTPDGELRAMLGGHRADVFAGGHTHIQLLRRYAQVHVVNPGSVGLPGVGPGGPDLPVNEAVAWAEYAVIEASGGDLSFELHRVALGVSAMLAVAAAGGMPHLDWWTGKWTGLRSASGSG